MMIWSHPEAMASSTPYWMMGLSTNGSISFGCALVAGRKRVPNPAAGKTALRTLAFIFFSFRFAAPLCNYSEQKVQLGVGRNTIHLRAPGRQPPTGRPTHVDPFSNLRKLSMMTGDR